MSAAVTIITKARWSDVKPWLSENCATVGAKNPNSGVPAISVDYAINHGRNHHDELAVEFYNKKLAVMFALAFG